MPAIDASIGAAWLLPDESNSHADDVYGIVVADGGFVPQHWHFEMRNALLRAERRGRLDANEANAHLIRLDEIAIERLETDESPNLDAAFSLARTHRLSFYDALYLELAMRRGLSLATLDNALLRAAIAEGLPPLPQP